MAERRKQYTSAKFGATCAVLLAFSSACNGLEADQSEAGDDSADGGATHGGVVPGSTAPGASMGDSPTGTVSSALPDDSDDPPDAVSSGTGDGSNPATTGSQGSPTGSQSLPGDPPLDPSANPTLAGLALFARLTRAEYARSVEESFGIVPDVTTLPEDGRTGPFTSNANPDPDPVHPYVLAAEQLALEIVPAILPACEAAELSACLEDNYHAPFESLLRRQSTGAEQASWFELVNDLLDAGESAEQASRTLVAAVLASGDFLFRSSSALDVAPLAERLAERASFALWDAPPDAELTAAGSSGDIDWLAQQTERLLTDERAIAVIARFMAQWLDVDTDLRLENPEFAQAPEYLELLARARLALQGNTSVSELVSGTLGVVHEDNLEAYALTDTESPAGDVTQVQWPSESKRRGLLAQELFIGSTRHPDTSRRPIFRGLLVRRALLCDTIPAPSADLVALAGEVGDRTQDMRCSGCHLRLDPIGRAFEIWDMDRADVAIPSPVVNGHAELEGTYADVAELLDAIGASRAFAECFSRNWLAFFLEQPLPDVDPTWVTTLADQVQAGATLGAVIQSTVSELDTRSQSFVPWCEVTP